jgi:hypothetical protein
MSSTTSSPWVMRSIVRLMGVRAVTILCVYKLTNFRCMSLVPTLPDSSVSSSCDARTSSRSNVQSRSRSGGVNVSDAKVNMKSN